jgi:diguanylate cyclase (GGDEF) domain
MDIYESMVKKCNIISFVVDSSYTVIDTNMYTMTLLESYDVTGKDFFSFFDDSSIFKIKSCLISEYFDPMPVNLISSSGSTKPATIIINRVGSYIAVFGICRIRNIENLSRHLEEINKQAELQSSAVMSTYDINGDNDKRMWQLNNIDSLTGLYNKKFFNSIYGGQYTRAIEGNWNMGVMMVSIDGFDEINEKYGTGKGDRLLVGLSQIILGSIRSTDYAVRYSASEILILLNNPRDKAINIIAERVRDNAEKKLGITISIGCTSLASGIKSKEELVTTALIALKTSLDDGGNLVTVV